MVILTQQHENQALVSRMRTKQRSFPRPHVYKNNHAPKEEERERGINALSHIHRPGGEASLLDETVKLFAVIIVQVMSGIFNDAYGRHFH